MSALKVALNPPRKGDIPDLVAGTAKAVGLRRNEVEPLWRKGVLESK